MEINDPLLIRIEDFIQEYDDLVGELKVQEYIYQQNRLVIMHLKDNIKTRDKKNIHDKEQIRIYRNKNKKIDKFIKENNGEKSKIRLRIIKIYQRDIRDKMLGRI